MKKPKITKAAVSKCILPGLIILQFILLAVGGWYLYWTRQSVNQQSTDKLALLINNAVNGLTWPVPTEARSGIIYINQAKIMLPAVNDNAHQLLYNDFSAPGEEQEVHFMDKMMVNSQENKIMATQDLNTIFNYVPKLQACARGYKVVFNDTNKSDDNLFLFSKKLDDGRTAYVSVDKGCTDRQADFVPYLKQIASY
jgi:hypothetical protein